GYSGLTSLPGQGDAVDMKAFHRVFSALILLVTSSVATAQTIETCDYAFMGVPMAKLRLTYDADGSLSQFAEASVGTGVPLKQVLIQELEPGEGERYHLAILDESSQPIEAIAYLQPTAQGEAKLINPSMPGFGREMWGSCRID